MQFTFNSVLQQDNDQLYNIYFQIPDQIQKELKAKEIKRFMCCINNGEPFHSSAIPAGEGKYFIKINKELRVQHRIELGAECRLALTEDKSKYGMPFPKELQELLLQDPEGEQYFHALPPGKQRNLLFLINKVKNADTRIEKSMIIIEHLKELNGKLDFKRLNEDFKNKRGTF